jgi:hypothetical protein
MDELDDEQSWEQLYTQFKPLSGDGVICMVHKRTKRHVYFDVQAKRLLSKQEARMYRVDTTGLYSSLA